MTLTPAQITTWMQAARRGLEPAPIISDTFPGAALDAAWLAFDAPSSGAAVAVSGGELNYSITTGGSGGAFWRDEFDGSMRYRLIGGPFDLRCRVRARNTADNGVPPNLGYRTAGLIVANPSETRFNYVYVGAGSGNVTGESRIEWCTTDSASDGQADTSCAGSIGPWTVTNGAVAADLRIVRRQTNQQIFDLYAKLPDTALTASTGWTLVQTINRTDNTVPDRNTVPSPGVGLGISAGANNAIPLPFECRVGMYVSSSAATSNVRGYFEEIRLTRTFV